MKTNIYILKWLPLSLDPWVYSCSLCHRTWVRGGTT